MKAIHSKIDGLLARIAVLEKAISQIAIGADGECVNEDDALTYSEIEYIAIQALGRPVIMLQPGVVTGDTHGNEHQ